MEAKIRIYRVDVFYERDEIITERTQHTVVANIHGVLNEINAICFQHLLK